MDHNKNFQTDSVVLDLVEALSFERNISNPRFTFYISENLAIACFSANEKISMRSCEHSHSDYEFIIPHTPLPYLTNDEAVYFGEVGSIYPVHKGRKHGTKYPINNVSYTSICINECFFDSILESKGLRDHVFNSIIPCSDNLMALIDMFKTECQKNENADIQNKTVPLTKIICAEIIDLASENTSDERKTKAKYQKGVRLAADYINENFAKNITIEELAEICGLSLNYFSLCFRNTFGETPKVYITKMRLSKAKTLLEFSPLQIKEIATVCGFQKFNSFSCSFKKYVGVTPSEYRDSLTLQNQ